MSKGIEENWKETWEPILIKADGSINLEQLKKELLDFSELICRMSELTCEITGDRLSYPTYPVKTILSVMEDVRNQDIEYQKECDIEDGICSLCDRKFT